MAQHCRVAHARRRPLLPQLGCLHGCLGWVCLARLQVGPLCAVCLQQGRKDIMCVRAGFAWGWCARIHTAPLWPLLCVGGSPCRLGSWWHPGDNCKTHGRMVKCISRCHCMCCTRFSTCTLFFLAAVGAGVVQAASRWCAHTGFWDEGCHQGLRDALFCYQPLVVGFCLV